MQCTACGTAASTVVAKEQNDADGLKVLNSNRECCRLSFVESFHINTSIN